MLFFDKEKNIQFQQSENNYLVSSFGLKPKSVSKLELTPVVKEKVIPILVERKVETEKVNRKVSKETIKKQTKIPSKRRRNIGAALVPFIVIPMLMATIFFGNQAGVIGKTPIQLASFNPFQSVNTTNYTPRNGKTFLEENKKVEINLVSVEKSIPTPETIEKEIPVKVETTENVIKASTVELKYHVIAGCFSVKENADNFVSKWSEKGNESSIIDRKGRLYRVAIQSFATRKEAAKFKKELKKQDKVSSWVLRK